MFMGNVFELLFTKLLFTIPSIFKWLFIQVVNRFIIAYLTRTYAGNLNVKQDLKLLE